MMKKLSIAALSLVSLLSTEQAISQPPKPKLILQIVVDQLRGDYIARYQSKFGPAGFNYLVKHGLWYSNAFHPHAKTTTCAGHATISTGTYPRYHGIVGNHWYSRQQQKDTYCMSDEKANILPLQSNELTSGRSPKNIMASTLSDEIVIEGVGRSFGVSFKDRGAITLAGHAGKAFWFDKSTGTFVSSSYYYKKLPLWVARFNDKKIDLNIKPWNLLNKKSSYDYPETGVNNKNYHQYGQSFPHTFDPQNKASLFKLLSMSPYADILTAEFAKQLMLNENIGTKKTDYLAISFSANDAIGHNFGPNSLESEDNLLRLDKTLANLFSFIDKRVGLENTLILLSADHGVSDTPDYLKTKHIDTGLVQLQGLLTHQLPQKLKERFGLTNAITAYSDPMIYLNHQEINDKKLSLKEVSSFIINQINALEGIYQSYDLNALSDNQIEADFVTTKIGHMIYAKRIGDIYIVPRPYWSLFKGSNPDRVSHGSPWNYDAYVPLIFANKHFKGKRISRQVETIDIAPTLAALLNIKPPSASLGHVLPEVVDYRP